MFNTNTSTIVISPPILPGFLSPHSRLLLQVYIYFSPEVLFLLSLGYFGIVCVRGGGSYQRASQCKASFLWQLHYDLMFSFFIFIDYVSIIHNSVNKWFNSNPTPIISVTTCFPQPLPTNPIMWINSPVYCLWWVEETFHSCFNS